MSLSEKTFSLGDLFAWQRDGDSAKPVTASQRRHVFSTVTHSSLPDGSPPMQPGGLFVAIKARRDGHDFAANAFQNGARAALVNRVPGNLEEPVRSGAVHALRPGGAPPTGDVPVLVIVPDTLQALQGCASWWRRQHDTPILAITGSVGKTTTKDLLTQILSRRGQVLSTRGNYNNEYGLPFMLLELTAEHSHAVLEIGISAIGEMELFARIAAPDVGIVTRVAPAHLEFFDDIDTVEREKGVLVASLPKSGIAVLNADDPRVARMAERTAARVVTYGAELPADVQARDVTPLGLDGVRFTLERGAASGAVTLPLAGTHFVACALAAAASALEVGATWQDVLAGLQAQPHDRRLQPIRLRSGITLLDDSYNASPAAMRAALDVLSTCPGRRIAVLGDMFELGEAGPDAHRDVGAYVPGRADVLLAVGALGQEIAAGALAANLPAEAVAWSDSNDAAADWLRPRLAAGDFVLVKGSRGMRMDEIVASLAGRELPAGHGGH